MTDLWLTFENYCGICGARTPQTVENGCLACRGRAARPLPAIVKMGEALPGRRGSGALRLHKSEAFTPSERHWRPAP